MSFKFYRDEPLFGLDIGHASLKAMQVASIAGKPPVIVGYGNSVFDPQAIANGVIVKPDAIASAMHTLFDKNIVGSINSRRVACALPTSHTFSRPMKLPPMEHDDIVEAIHLEAEQYIPVPITNLYVDYELTHQDDQGVELLLVAIPRPIVDSYVKLLESLKLEPVAFEPSINASSRLLQMGDRHQAEPAVVADIGSVATDIAVFDKTLLVSSTVNSGGETITDLISKGLHLTHEQANKLKNEEGIVFSDRQQRIIDAIKPVLESLVHEIQKVLRYYSERAAKSGGKISQIVTFGGGSIMPGFNQYLSKELRLPTQNLDPWQKVSFGQLPVPGKTEAAIYTTAAGEAILRPEEITK